MNDVERYRPQQSPAGTTYMVDELPNIGMPAVDETNGYVRNAAASMPGVPPEAPRPSLPEQPSWDQAATEQEDLPPEPTIAQGLLDALQNTITTTNTHDEAISAFSEQQAEQLTVTAEALGEKVLAQVLFAEYTLQTMNNLEITNKNMQLVQAELVSLRQKLEKESGDVSGLDALMQEQISNLNRLTQTGWAKLAELKKAKTERENFDTYRSEHPDDRDYTNYNMEWRATIDNVIRGLEREAGVIGMDKLNTEQQYNDTANNALSYTVPYEDLERAVRRQIALSKKYAEQVNDLQQELRELANADTDYINAVAQRMLGGISRELTPTDGRSFVDLINKLTGNEPAEDQVEAVQTTKSSENPSPTNSSSTPAPRTPSTADSFQVQPLKNVRF